MRRDECIEQLRALQKRLEERSKHQSGFFVCSTGEGLRLDASGQAEIDSLNEFLGLERLIWPLLEELGEIAPGGDCCTLVGWAVSHLDCKIEECEADLGAMRYERHSTNLIDHPYRVVAMAIDRLLAHQQLGSLTEPMTKQRIGDLFVMHRNQVTKQVLSKYRHVVEPDGRIRMQVADMPPHLSA